MKRLARFIIVAILGWQVRRLRRKHDFKVVAVAGSIGKTSTKFAIAQVLGQNYRVRFQEGNYNDLVTVPLVFFGEAEPSLFNPIAWAKTLLTCELQLHRQYPWDIVIVEVGTNGPGDMVAFEKYLHADIAVLTSITPEHMEFFADLDAVAIEELAIQDYSDVVLVNADLTDKRYVDQIERVETYALHHPATYKVTKFAFQTDGVQFEITKGNDNFITASHTGISEPHLYSLTAAASVADRLGMSPEDIVSALTHVLPVSGRMQSLKGIRNSTIIDDSYNASPEAVKAALETLYRVDAPQKIALLGNMNELGDFSAEAHKDVGSFCDPQQLTEVITLGPDANEYLAPAARKAGCEVTQFDTPYKAGEYLQQIITDGAVVLVKGSQNRVYAEEAIKSILANPADAAKLVRQSPAWLKKKAQNFKTA
jgi:UDP-N-acetylmuramoyl-tripeptide--D-alanyl-D-alanine ligase